MNRISTGAAPRETSARAYLTKSRLISVLLLLFGLLIATILIGATFGTVHINLIRAFTDSSSPDHAIFFSARLPRLTMAVVVGATLATVGAALQALVRNPLAEGEFSASRAVAHSARLSR